MQRQSSYLHSQWSFVASQFRFTLFYSSDSSLHHCSVNILLLRSRCVAYIGETEEDTPNQNIFCDWGKVNNQTEILLQAAIAAQHFYLDERECCTQNISLKGFNKTASHHGRNAMDEKAKNCISAEWRCAASQLESAAQTGTAPLGAESWEFERNIQSKAL